MKFEWRVKKGERGMSLENFIYKKLGDWSHKRVKMAIDQKRTFVNGRNVFISKWNVKPNDVVLFTPPDDLGLSVSEKMRYRFVDVLYEDDVLLLANKPPFIDFETYVKMITDYIKRKSPGRGYPYVGQMHRLDKETSGVMVFTKKKIANAIADQFRDHSIRKFYRVIVEGRMAKDHGWIDAPIEKGAFDEGKKVRIHHKGKSARTDYEVLERYDQATLLRVEIKTGRTHQIRIHMHHLGHPVVGDKLYQGSCPVPFKRQALHAERLDFSHPITRKRMKIMAPLPQDMQALIDQLRGI